MKMILILICLAFAARAQAPQSDWLSRAQADPEIAARVNPYAGDEDARRAGEKLFRRYCQSCHGPNIQTPRARQASPGALFWLLENGSLGKGMPSWSSLPPERRWQLVDWIKGPSSLTTRH